MVAPRRTWGIVRRIYFGAGVIGLILAMVFLFIAGAENPLLLFVVPVLVICAAVLPDDELFNRIHRIFWRREWPK